MDFLNKILVYVPIILGIGVSAYILYLKHRNRFEVPILKKLIWLFLIFNIVFAAAQIYIQYRVYAGDSFARLMLPPYQSWRWFGQYSFFHFIAPFIAALAAGIHFSAPKADAQTEAAARANQPIQVNFALKAVDQIVPVDAAVKIDMVNDQLAGKEMNIGRYYQRANQPLAAVVNYANAIAQPQSLFGKTASRGND